MHQPIQDNIRYTAGRKLSLSNLVPTKQGRDKEQFQQDWSHGRQRLPTLEPKMWTSFKKMGTVKPRDRVVGMPWDVDETSVKNLWQIMKTSKNNLNRLKGDEKKTML